MVEARLRASRSRSMERCSFWAARESAVRVKVSVAVAV